MTVHPSHRQELQRAVTVLGWTLACLILIAFTPVSLVPAGMANYLPLHISLETLSIVVGVLVFAVSWSSSQHHAPRNALILGCGFLGVSVLDFSHMLSYQGMPTFITPNSPEKAIHFWLSARTLGAVCLLYVALTPWSRTSTRQQARACLLGLGLGIAFLHWIFMAHPGLLPDTFIEGQGLTPLKIRIEYGLVALYLASAILLARHLGQPRQFHASGLLAVACIMAMSEFFFTLYADVTDGYNLTGHLYKVIASLYLFRALFIETIQGPYEQLAQSRARLSATLDALPDLLFEIDETGRYLDVHASRPQALAAPQDRLIGKTIHDILPPEAAQTIMEAIRETSQTGRSRGKRISLEVPEGKRCFELSVSRQPVSPFHAPTYLFISRDITERVQSEASQRQEAQLSATLLSIPTKLAQLSTEPFLLEMMTRVRELTGATYACAGIVSDDQHHIQTLCISAEVNGNPVNRSLDQHPIPSTSPWLEAIGTGRPSHFDGLAPNQAEGKLPGDMVQAQRIVVVPVHDDAKLRFICAVANKAGAFTNPDFDALHIISRALWRYLHNRNIDTELHRLSLAVEQNPYPVVITDTNAHIEYVNEAFTRSTGYTKQEARGVNPRILKSGKTPQSTYREMWQHLTNGQAWRGEFVNRRKNGEEYTEQAFIYPVRSSTGLITHYLAHKEDISAKKAADERIVQLSHYDQLTGLPNQALLSERFHYAASNYRRNHESFAILWLDIDPFNNINDSLGHAAGDHVLREVTQRLRTVVREQDTLARQSGDDFVLLLPGADQNGATRVASAMLDVLAAPLNHGGQELILTASIGIALFPNDGEELDAMLRSAEAAMYNVKDGGRNGFRFFAPEMQASASRVLAVNNALKLALTRNELRLVYQPQIRISDQRMIGAEALLRWQHPTWGNVSPGEFIPIAENTDLIGQLDEWVLRTALQQLSQWNAEGLTPFKLSINLSASQFAQAGFPQKLRSLVEQTQLPAARIELELTEAVAMKNPLAAAQRIDELVAQGHSLAIDDFGTGYSSLSYLKRFAVSKLKIDQSFVKDLETDVDDQALVRAIIHMAHGLGIHTIAEGVETQAQLEFLQHEGCDEVQGYYFSRPLESRDFAEYVKAHS